MSSLYVGQRVVCVSGVVGRLCLGGIYTIRVPPSINDPWVELMEVSGDWECNRFKPVSGKDLLLSAIAASRAKFPDAFETVYKPAE